MNNLTNTQNLIVLELLPQEILEKRIAHVVELVDLADNMGYDINGFMDENDLLRKLKDTEINLLSDLIYKKDNYYPMEDQLRTEIKLEKFHAIACRILDALEKY